MEKGSPAKSILSAPARCAAAVAAVAAAWLLTRLMWPSLRDNPAIVFFAAVVLSAMQGGLAPGVLAAVLAAVVLQRHFAPHGSPAGLDAGDVVRLAVFLLVVLPVSWAGAARRRSQRDLRDAYASLEQRVEERTAALEAANMRLQREADHRICGEQSLREGEARKSAIVESSLDCIIVMDHRGRVTEFNPAAERTFGYAAADAVGRELAELIIPPAQRDAHRRALARYLEAGGGTMVGRRVEATGLRADGSEVAVELAIARVDLPGPPLFSASLRDVGDRKRAEAELLAHQRQLRALAAQLSLGEERERRRLACHLHDQVGQTLAAAQMRLESLPELPPSADLSAAVAAVSELIEEAIGHTRALTADLSPPVLYEAGLPAALEWLADRLRRRYGLRVEVDASPPPPPPSSPSSSPDPGQSPHLPDWLRGLLFQAARELLTNTAKHARAARARVSVAAAPAGTVRVRVEDDGVGFDVAAALRPGGGGFGLFNLRERLRAACGTLVIDSAPGRGTRVELEVSVPPSGSGVGGAADPAASGAAGGGEGDRAGGGVHV